MAKKNFSAFCAVLIIISFFCGCKKFTKTGHMNEPGIVLTFDDDRVDNWFTYLPLLDSLGVKATFTFVNTIVLRQSRKENFQ